MTIPRGHAMEDHPVDCQIHGWGPLMEDAFSETALSLFEMISPSYNDKEAVQDKVRHNIEISAPTPEKLLFFFLNECLGKVFCENNVLVGRVDVSHISKSIDVVPPDEEEEEQEQQEKEEEDDTIDDDSVREKIEKPRLQTIVWNLHASLYGETWDRNKHEPGTEAKAITMHGLKVEQREEDMCFHCFAIVDI